MVCAQEMLGTLQWKKTFLRWGLIERLNTGPTVYFAKLGAHRPPLLCLILCQEKKNLKSSF